MRLAGDQQHAQLVAHAVDGDHRAVVHRRQLALERRGFDLDDVLARMRHIDIDRHGLAAQHGALVDGLPVTAHHDLRALAGDALIVEPVGDLLRLADDAEAWRGDDGDAAVALVLAAGDQRMHRRAEAERRHIRRNVVHTPVGDQEGAGDAVGRHVRQRGGQRREQPRAVGLAVGLAGLDHAHLEALDLLQPVEQLLARLFGFPRAVAEVLARALVDHDGGHRRQRLAILARE